MSTISEDASPLPLFDSLTFLESSFKTLRLPPEYDHADIEKSIAFLQAYQGSQGTFNAYRREVERLLHWSTFVAKKTLKHLNRGDVENFLEFCRKPPTHWIGTQKYPRFCVKNGIRQP